MKKILFYFTHNQTLGHSKRIINIINWLKKNTNSIEISVFAGGKPQPCLKTALPSRVTWITLPFSDSSKFKFQGINSNENIRNANFDKRINYATKKLHQIKPDIFITDFFPFGRPEYKKEIFLLIKSLKSKGTKIFASIGYPYFTINPKKILPICKLYDKFLIHTPPNLDTNYFYRNIEKEKHTTKQDYIKLFNNEIKNKLVYTGYISSYSDPKKNINTFTNKFSSKGKILVVVSRGGGTYYPKIIAYSIIAKKYLDNNYIFLVIPGPATSKSEMNLFQKCIDKLKTKNIHLIKYIDTLSSILKTADISISTAGYNTTVDLFSLKKKAILIPFMGYNPNSVYIEQLCHAQILQDYIGSKILSYSKFNPKIIADNIKSMAKAKFHPKVEIDKSWFEGGEKTAKILLA